MTNDKAVIEKLEELVNHLGPFSDCDVCQELIAELTVLKSENKEKECNHANWVKQYNFKQCIDCGYTWPYEEAGSAIYCHRSDIPKAIRQYYVSQPRPSPEQVVEVLKKYWNINEYNVTFHKVAADLLALQRGRDRPVTGSEDKVPHRSVVLHAIVLEIGRQRRPRRGIPGRQQHAALGVVVDIVEARGEADVHVAHLQPTFIAHPQSVLAVRDLVARERHVLVHSGRRHATGE